MKILEVIKSSKNTKKKRKKNQQYLPCISAFQKWRISCFVTKPFICNVPYAACELLLLLLSEVSEVLLGMAARLDWRRFGPPRFPSGQGKHGLQQGHQAFLSAATHGALLPKIPAPEHLRSHTKRERELEDYTHSRLSLVFAFLLSPNDES